MINNYQKIATILFYVLMAVAVIFGLIFYLGKVVPGTKGTNMEEPLITNKFLVLTYIYFGIAALLTILFPVIYIITHPTKVKGVLISLLAFALIVLIAYLMSSGKQLPDNPEISTTTMKLVDTGLKSSYIFLALAFIGILYSELSSIFR